MSEKEAKNRLLEGIGEVDDVYYQEAEYTEEELERLNVKDGRKTKTGATVVTGAPMPETDDLEEQLREIPKLRETASEVKTEAAPKRKVGTILWITAGVALAAAAILLFVYLWNPNRSDVVATTEEEQQTTEEEQQTTDLSSAKVGDTVRFGHYDDKNEWIVLDKGEKTLLLSKDVICKKKFNEKYVNVLWSECSLREWLNNEYIAQAFSAEELECIADTDVRSAILPGEKDSIDKVFLLSAEEATKYFSDDARRVAHKDEGLGWGLRSPGYSTSSVAYVNTEGSVFISGCDVDLDSVYVRPALWVDISGDPKLDAEVPSASVNESMEANEDKPLVGTTVNFGHYGDTNEWIVLDETEDRIFLLSKNAICEKEYSEEGGDATWSTCSLRRWLNSEYLSVAFSGEERACIADTLVKTPDNPGYGTPGGDDSVDQVFVLSVDEAWKYLEAVEWKTDYATSFGTEIQGYPMGWWLRTPGEDSRYVTYVKENGPIGTTIGIRGTGTGLVVGVNVGAVRPALWVDKSIFD